MNLYPTVRDLTEAEYDKKALSSSDRSSSSSSLFCGATAETFMGNFSLQDLLKPTSDYPQSISSLMPTSVAAPTAIANGDESTNGKDSGTSKKKKPSHKRGRSLFHFALSSSSTSSASSSSRNSKRIVGTSTKTKNKLLHRRSHSSPLLSSTSERAETSSPVRDSYNSNSNHDESTTSATSMLSEELSKEFVIMENVKFEDYYVLTRQIYRCNVSSIWECVNREEGTRHCVKIIDRRRFSSSGGSPYGNTTTSRREENAALKEISMMTFFRSYAPNTTKQLTNAVQVSEDLHNFYIVMDHVEGANLANYTAVLRQQQIDERLQQRRQEDEEGQQSRLEHYPDYHLFPGSKSSGSSSMRIDGAIMTELQVQQFARSLLTAVKEVHQLGICHGDIQPENILLKHNQLNQVVLCDFGCARFVDTSISGNDDTQQRQNPDRRQQVGGHNIRRPSPIRRRHKSLQSVVGGNLNYTAPEVLTKSLDHDTTLASDMWSVGVILYQCLCGSLPFDDSINVRSGTATSSRGSMGDSGTSVSSTHSISSHRSNLGSGTGTPSSSSSRRTRLKENIVNANYSFARKEWKFVTRTAKQFLSTLLHPDPMVRMTVHEALDHIWLTKTSPPFLVSPTVPRGKSKQQRRRSNKVRRSTSLMKRVLGTIAMKRTNSHSRKPESQSQRDYVKDAIRNDARDIDLNTASTLSSVASVEESTRRRELFSF